MNIKIITKGYITSIFVLLIGIIISLIFILVFVDPLYIEKFSCWIHPSSFVDSFGQPLVIQPQGFCKYSDVLLYGAFFSLLFSIFGILITTLSYLIYFFKK